MYLVRRGKKIKTTEKSTSKKKTGVGLKRRRDKEAGKRKRTEIRKEEGLNLDLFPNPGKTLMRKKNLEILKKGLFNFQNR